MLLGYKSRLYGKIPEDHLESIDIIMFGEENMVIMIARVGVAVSHAVLPKPS